MCARATCSQRRDAGLSPASRARSFPTTLSSVQSSRRADRRYGADRPSTGYIVPIATCRPPDSASPPCPAPGITSFITVIPAAFAAAETVAAALT